MKISLSNYFEVYKAREIVYIVYKEIADIYKELNSIGIEKWLVFN